MSLGGTPGGRRRGMDYFCPATGHVVDRQVLHGKVGLADAFCPDHGVRVFRNCSSCGAIWPGQIKSYAYRITDGSDFCSACGTPAPWLERDRLIEWLLNQVQASDLPLTTRHELRAVLEQLGKMAPDDTKSIAGWQQVRDKAPKVWEASKPVRDALISESLRVVLESMMR